MNRRVLLTGAVGAAAGALVRTPEAAARKPADADFLPLTVGSRWSYVANDGHESEETVSGTVDVKGDDARSLGVAAAMAVGDGGEYFYLRTEKGVVRFYDPPSATTGQDRVTWILRFPLHHGSRWESWTPAGKVEFRVTDRRSVTAPDGSLTDGIRVDFVSLPEPIFAGHIWYARGIGPIEVVEGDYTRKLLGYRPGNGPEVPVAKRLAGIEPPSLAQGWKLGRKGWFALVLMAATAAGLALLPRMRRGGPKRAKWEEQPAAPVALDEEGSLAVQAARLEASIATHPKYADLRCKLGLLYDGMERYDDAIAQFRTSLELNPHYVQAGLGLTRALKRAKRPDEAVKVIRPFAEKHPTYADVQNLLGEALAEAGDVAAAEASFRRALEINPAFQAARANLDRWTKADASG